MFLLPFSHKCIILILQHLVIFLSFVSKLTGPEDRIITSWLLGITDPDYFLFCPHHHSLFYLHCIYHSSKYIGLLSLPGYIYKMPHVIMTHPFPYHPKSFLLKFFTDVLNKSIPIETRILYFHAKRAFSFQMFKVVNPANICDPEEYGRVMDY